MTDQKHGTPESENYRLTCFKYSASASSEQLFCTTKRESSSELALDPYSQSKGCECPIMHTPRRQEILYFKLSPKNQVLDEDCAQQTKVSTIPRKHISVDFLKRF
ncbi:unnamed protein product [Larinioides sclopetarius]|uniref:Uncharacterized protein n=1 Tax=Larinioides sclopetarius TaxID=280406 RepID=A0AAV1YUM1_9ARAC